MKLKIIKNKRRVIFITTVVLVLIAIVVDSYISFRKTESLIVIKEYDVCKNQIFDNDKERCNRIMSECNVEDEKINKCAEVKLCRNRLNYSFVKNENYKVQAKAGFPKELLSLGEKVPAIKQLTDRVGRISTVDFIVYLDQIGYPIDYGALYFDYLSEVTEDDESHLVVDFISKKYKQFGSANIIAEVSSNSKFRGAYMGTK